MSQYKTNILKSLPFATCPRPLVIVLIIAGDGNDFMLTSLELMLMTTVQSVLFRSDYLMANGNLQFGLNNFFLQNRCNKLLTLAIVVVVVVVDVAVVVRVNVASLANLCDLLKLKIDGGLC